MNIPQPWILSTDRTEWSFGQTRFNILMLGVVHDGVAYPLVWTMLDKKGNSNSNERMDLLDRFRQIFPDAKIAYLSGDREFVGKEWLTYLLIEPTISFRLRIRLWRASPKRSVVGTLQRASERISRWKKAIKSVHCFCQFKTRSNSSLIWSPLGLGSLSVYFCFTLG